jgi:hypothetical protein
VKHKRLLLTVAWAAASLVGLAFYTADPVSAQDCPTIAKEEHAWPPGVDVMVTFSGYNQQEIDAIKQVLANWGGSNTNAGVNYVYGNSSTTYKMTWVKADPQGVDSSGRVRQAEVNNWTWSQTTGWLTSMTMRTHTAITNLTALQLAASHEIGHGHGEGHCTSQCLTTATAMSDYDANKGYNDTSTGSVKPTDCDKKAIEAWHPTPHTEPPPPPGGGGGDYYGGGSGGICTPGGFTMMIDGFEVYSGPCISPVLIDVNGDGFGLTDVRGGVTFDLNADGTPDRIAWTAMWTDDAWLALDRNSDGLISSGAELFGNYTPQPDPPAGVERNGFLALAEFDEPQQGGNGDGVIDTRDAVFPGLRLWRDADHDGFSQPGELHTLAEFGLASISLDYKESKRADEHGNAFRYRAKVKDIHGAQVGRWAWDVFLVVGR